MAHESELFSPGVRCWEQYFLDIAVVTASRSKDPSTKVGCVITSKDHIQLAAGYNGFPRGVADSDERFADRATKLKWMVHAEANAIANAAKRGIALAGSTLYVHPYAPCPDCAKLTIQAGINRVVIGMPLPDRLWPRGDQSGILALIEGGVEVRLMAGSGAWESLGRCYDEICLAPCTRCGAGV